MTAAPGLRFTERLRGAHVRVERADAPPARGEGGAEPCALTVTVTTPDLARWLADPGAPATVIGTLEAPALADTPLMVHDGTLTWWRPDPDHVQARVLRYRATLTARDGTHYALEGVKRLRRYRPEADLWRDTTTVDVTVRTLDSAPGPVVARGRLRIHPADLARQLATVRVTAGLTPGVRVRILAQVGRAFTDVLTDVYGRVPAPSRATASGAGQRLRRPLRAPTPSTHDVGTVDGVRLRLTRYPGGAKGPVLMVPGFGTTAAVFALDTVDPTLTEYLCAHGYDVWLFDYRASPALPSAARPFTLDDVATQDYPAAVAKVLAVTRVPSIQVVAHCMGAMTLLMALLAGLQGVRSAVCSQVGLHPVPGRLNAMRARLHLPRLLRGLGVKTLTTGDAGSGWLDQRTARLAGLLPTRERCAHPVCRRILFLYGDVFSHEQLTQATHDALGEVFGVVNLRAFAHITRILRAGHVVDDRGRDVYLPHLRRLALPIAFLHGAENRLFVPCGTERTYELLRARLGPGGLSEPGGYARRVVPGYAHMDCVIGRDAVRNVYPLVLETLGRHLTGAGSGHGRST